jgi:hypothetical protein
MASADFTPLKVPTLRTSLCCPRAESEIMHPSRIKALIFIVLEILVEGLRYPNKVACNIIKYSKFLNASKNYFTFA